MAAATFQVSLSLGACGEIPGDWRKPLGVLEDSLEKMIIFFEKNEFGKNDHFFSKKMSLEKMIIFFEKNEFGKNDLFFEKNDLGEAPKMAAETFQVSPGFHQISYNF